MFEAKINKYAHDLTLYVTNFSDHVTVSSETGIAL